MSGETHLLSLEIEQLARERDDFLAITALPGQNGWEALVRKLNSEEQLKLDAILTERDPAAVATIQGYVAALRAVKWMVETAEEGAKNRTEDIADKTRIKDDMLVQEEYQRREALSPQY